MDQRSYKLIQIRRETAKVNSFFFEFPTKPAPGQFFMITVSGIDEVPMSAGFYKDGIAGISVFNVGEASSALHSLKEGDYIGVRGPYGRPFTENKGKGLLIAGGYGSSPLVYYAEELIPEGAEITAILGARNKDLLLFKERFEKICKTYCTTDDGSFGRKGIVTDELKEVLKNESFDFIYTCGPEAMEKAVFGICKNNEAKFEASLERYMKCGIGICGACVLDGYRVCTDGPIFDKEQLLEMEEFGNTIRDVSGLIISE